MDRLHSVKILKNIAILRLLQIRKTMFIYQAETVSWKARLRTIKDKNYER
jgi:hypothetical protein